MKIINKLIHRQHVRSSDAELAPDYGNNPRKRKRSFSFEYFPPKTERGVVNLNARVQRMVQQHDPLFLDLTWGAGGSTSETTLGLASQWSREGHCVNMHLTCTKMPIEKIDQALDGARHAGIRNLVALRGDPVEGESEWAAVEGGFRCALDLIQYIRRRHGDWFCLSVAGYPEGHPNQLVEVEIGGRGEPIGLSQSEIGRVSYHDGKWWVCPDDRYWADLRYLRDKIEAGGDLIITQLFYDPWVFLKFVQDCRSLGITCPIVPGIMLIQNLSGFFRMTGLCRTRIPMTVSEELEEFRDREEQCRSSGDSEEVKKVLTDFQEYGRNLVVNLCEILAEEGGVDFFHLYTLNKEVVAAEVIKALTLSS